MKTTQLLFLTPVLAGMVFPVAAQKLISLQIGFSDRITPVLLHQLPSVRIHTPSTVSTEVDDQVNGSGVSLGIAITHSKIKTAFYLRQSLRYTYLYTSYPRFDTLQAKSNPYFTFGNDEYRLVFDTHFGLRKYITLASEKFFIDAGYSYMNRGTGYGVTEYVPNGTFISAFNYRKNFNFDAWDIRLGYTRKNLCLSIGGYYVAHTPNYDFDYQMIIPEIALAYNFRLTDTQTKDKHTD